jgi:2-oxo-4-hydroxy-4-carboxy-5-ureidoimidazoline decarboxylase
MNALRNKYASTASAEQGQVTNATEGVLLALREKNLLYLEKFGFIFIVCATGKSASEMLALLEARINNSPDEELVNGAREQGEIMNLRLSKLLKDD